MNGLEYRLECPKCQYGYSNGFSGRLDAENVELEGDTLIIKIPCEGGCGYWTVIKAKLISVKAVKK